jgi:hypothetical protein
MFYELTALGAVAALFLYYRYRVIADEREQQFRAHVAWKVQEMV